MSRHLRDLAERRLKNTLVLTHKGKPNEVLKELEKAEKTAKLLIKDPENEFFNANLQINFYNFFTLSKLSYEMGR
ncbi:MAG: hypothetical protein QG646_148, partial [Euryarchaeota archaeon]|nr:hypothetical protein [Euryarchaeota archaeon]